VYNKSQLEMKFYFDHFRDNGLKGGDKIMAKKVAKKAVKKVAKKAAKKVVKKAAKKVAKKKVAKKKK
jgi:hypothetical protein